MATTARIMPDHTRRNVRGTEYITAADEYSAEGTLIGVGTNERVTFARACGVAFASPLPPAPNKTTSALDEIWEEVCRG